MLDICNKQKGNEHELQGLNKAFIDYKAKLRFGELSVHAECMGRLPCLLNDG